VNPSTPIERRPAARVDIGRPGAAAERLGQALVLASVLGGLGGLILLCCWGVFGRV
jgi:hypothetical protein